MPRSRLTIGEVAAQLGTTASALRHYEREGLVAPARSDGGHRRYDTPDLRQLRLVDLAATTGFSTRQIRALLAATPDGHRAAHAVLHELEQRIDAATRLQKTLRCAVDHEPYNPVADRCSDHLGLHEHPPVAAELE